MLEYITLQNDNCLCRKPSAVLGCAEREFVYDN